MSRHVRCAARWLVVVAVAPLAAACTGGDDDVTPTTTEGTSPAPPTTTGVPVQPVDLVAAYVLALADPGADPDLVATGDALLYREHRQLAAAALGSPLTALPGTTEHQLCSGDGCATISAVVVDPATGRVASFSVDGRPLAGRIAGAGPIADDDGLVAQTRTAYVANAGQLVVAVEVSNTTGTDVELFGFAAVLHPADGSVAVEAASGFGDTTVAAGGVGHLVLAFDTAQLGGRVDIRGLRSDGLDVELEVDVPAA